MKKYNRTKIPANLRRTKLHINWNSMIQRCNNKASTYYAKGIKVCPEWNSDFMAFYNYVTALPNYDYDNIGTGKEQLTLDRIRNNEGYKPGNVRWATKKEQFENSEMYVVIKSARA